MTPYAYEHLRYLKVEANKYTVDVIKDDEYAVWRKKENNSPHIVNWSSKTCSNCHHYAENLLPCVHLYAIWIHHKTVGVRTKTDFGEWYLISQRDKAFEHIFGKCYHISTLQDVIKTVSSVRPIFLESISHDQEITELKLQKKTCRGRPQSKRYASSCDNFLTGTIHKRSKSLSSEEHSPKVSFESI